LLRQLALTSGRTTAPTHLAEADLLSLMDKNGIGKLKPVASAPYPFIFGNDRIYRIAVRPWVRGVSGISCGTLSASSIPSA
jgi:hypothetical protein